MREVSTVRLLADESQVDLVFDDGVFQYASLRNRKLTLESGEELIDRMRAADQYGIPEPENVDG